MRSEKDIRERIQLMRDRIDMLDPKLFEGTIITLKAIVFNLEWILEKD